MRQPRAGASSPAEKLWLEQTARKLEAEGFEVRAARIEAGSYTLDCDTATAQAFAPPTPQKR
jgi:16S rRNA G527 N7-methylase RsmG